MMTAEAVKARQGESCRIHRPIELELLDMIGFGTIALALVVIGGGFVALLSMKGSSTLTWVLVGVLALVLALGVAILLLKPVSHDIHIAGPPGAAFAGEVTVDGVRSEIRGIAPQRYSYQGRSGEYVIILTKNPDTTSLELDGYTSTYGVRGGFQRESAMMSSVWMSSVDETLYDDVASRLLPPESAVSDAAGAEPSPP